MFPSVQKTCRSLTSAVRRIRSERFKPEHVWPLKAVPDFVRWILFVQKVCAGDGSPASKCHDTPRMELKLREHTPWQRVEVCYRVKLVDHVTPHCECSFLRKLISWVCQVAMRGLQATGSCYHSQVWIADKPTITAGAKVVWVCVCCARMWVFPRPEDRNLSMVAEIVGITGIPPDSRQPRTRLWERDLRGVWRAFLLPALSTLKPAQVQYFTR